MIRMVVSMYLSVQVFQTAPMTVRSSMISCTAHNICVRTEIIIIIIFSPPLYSTRRYGKYDNTNGTGTYLNRNIFVGARR